MKIVLTCLMALCAAGTLGAEPEKKPILLVLTNHGELGSTGQPTGFFLSEAAHPWEVFRGAGYPVRVASPMGGLAPVDPKSLDLKDRANETFWKAWGGEENGRKGVKDTLPLAKVNPSDYAAIFFAGGHGAMWDFPSNIGLQKVTAAIYEQGGAVGAVCHGPAALVGVMLSDGTPLVKGKKVAPFTNAEEKAAGLTQVVPFLLEDRFKSLGAIPVPGANFTENAVRDGRLATGQNPASATKTARLLVEALEGR
jgi:putative intracellular protease/amidase